ncbi:hypothetical protein [Microbispora sp. KK1-11]|uniref:hypothetical protein n=1 Tax=Microbispora sp. KK1-11 TaxID=2053005 RepID=UPI001159FB40|nr:hypothetical protein [Microbispora sp. KK1-11]TQS30006.1 hypothetical protein FLW16_06495 [Microbispora sp. KK1-11]
MTAQPIAPTKTLAERVAFAARTLRAGHGTRDEAIAYLVQAHPAEVDEARAGELIDGWRPTVRQPRRIPWRGGPQISDYAEDAYAQEQADDIYDLYGEDEL